MSELWLSTYQTKAKNRGNKVASKKEKDGVVVK